MGNEHLAFERYHWFDAEIKKKRYPNARKLAEHFEISARSAQRAISFMRDMLDAPLRYDQNERGYAYNDAFSLPDLPVSQEELLAVLLARNLLSGADSGFIGQAIQKFGRKLFHRTGDMGLSERRIRQCFSAVWHGHVSSQAAVFRLTTKALLTERPLSFIYHSPLCHRPTLRTVEPHHLQHYMGSWVLLAWCRRRQDWRLFYLARMEQASLGEQSFQRRPASAWRHLLQGGFGIFQDEETFPVTIRFTPFMAGWLREQLWHPEQIMQENDDNSLTLTVPVADLREIRMKVLQFGAEAEVLEPETLRASVREEADRLAALYRS